jgi:hypothetical protein
MNEPLPSLLAGLVSGAITAGVTYFATLAKARLDLTIEYDKELRQNRLVAYTELWKRLKPLARYSPERPVTYEIAKATSEAMRDWYFDQGGIYLSRVSREPYFELKEVLQKIIDDPELQNSTDTPLRTERLSALHTRATALRNELSNDIGTRRRAFV